MSKFPNFHVFIIEMNLLFLTDMLFFCLFTNLYSVFSYVCRPLVEAYPSSAASSQRLPGLQKSQDPRALHDVGLRRGILYNGNSI